MPRTIDIWAMGTYRAQIRPKPRHQVHTYEIKESFPVSISCVADDEAPIAIEYASNWPHQVGQPFRFREHAGRLYLPTGHRSLESFLRSTREGDYLSTFLRANDAKTLEEWTTEAGATVMSTERDGFAAVMAEQASNILIVDDVPHKAVREPILVLAVSSNPEEIQCQISFDRNELRYGGFRIDDVDTMRSAAGRLADATGIHAFVDRFVDLTVHSDDVLAFDEKAGAAQDLAALGRSSMTNRDLQYFSDDLVQALLDLRKINAMPREHVDERYAAAMDAAVRAAREFPGLPDRVLGEQRWLGRALQVACAAHEARMERDAQLALEGLGNAFR